MLRTQLLPAFEMSESKLDQFIATIRSVKPRMLFGYPSALTHIAVHARKRGVTMTDLGIKVAFVTSERLYDEQRSTIGQVFGCKVANGYGGRDRSVDLVRGEAGREARSSWRACRRRALVGHDQMSRAGDDVGGVDTDEF